MASAASDGPPPGPTMTMFSDMDGLTINDGKFTQVFGDYHVHGNVDIMDEVNPLDRSSAANSFKATGGIQVGRDYHHHVHHHYPTIKRRNHFSAWSDVEIEVSTVLSGDPHYHVFRGGDIVFCTRFSPIYQQKNFPVHPSYEAMKKYASILLDEIDAGMYDDMGFRRPEYFRRYMPSRRRPYQTNLPAPWPLYARGTYVRHQPIVSPKFDPKDYVPPFDLLNSEDDKENIHMYPCMQAHAGARKSSSPGTSSPREALFSHLDRSGVK